MKEIRDAELAPVIGMDVSVVPKWVEVSAQLGSRDPRGQLMRSAAHRQRVVEVLRAEYLSTHGDIR